ncbi:M15 family metallopeptidase [Vibrio sp. SM6]|uniref:M15 family metallopeptidase n=1 Tax=Vibrio agarilyticus TaxID=2726741 RepID=A0A7X8YGZ9_9VIBR|nr:M15 family metallopeptidase [Vibrio agarilyticus]NLS13209.1 M15 family metallopeptidase [Vibrio agarilyticus]
MSTQIPITPLTPNQLTGLDTGHLTPFTIHPHSAHERQVMIHHQVCDALTSLIDAARLAGFTLDIASGFRDYARQTMIWNGKFSGERTINDENGQAIDALSLNERERVDAILRWSALPGASRHHWGCDFDLYAVNALPENVPLQLEPWEYLTGHQAPFYRWLKAHAGQYGFFFPYAQYQGGVAFEPWHLSHYAVATDCLAQLTPEILATQWQANPFLGVDRVLAALPKLYTQYIANICLVEEA